jgi:hypothetical protein
MEKAHKAHKDKYGSLKENNTLMSHDFGTITTLKYAEKLFPHWHLDQPLHIGDLVVYDRCYYSVVGIKKEMLQLKRVVHSFKRWIMLDNKIKSKRVKKVSLYKKCPQQYNYQEYQVFLNKKLPKTDDIIAEGTDIFLMLCELKNENAKQAITALKERLDQYLSMQIGDSITGTHSHLVDHILVLLTQ